MADDDLRPQQGLAKLLASRKRWTTVDHRGASTLTWGDTAVRVAPLDDGIEGTIAWAGPSRLHLHEAVVELATVRDWIKVPSQCEPLGILDPDRLSSRMRVGHAERRDDGARVVFPASRPWSWSSPAMASRWSGRGDRMGGSVRRSVRPS
jgi:hypothetical protein